MTTIPLKLLYFKLIIIIHSLIQKVEGISCLFDVENYYINLLLFDTMIVFTLSKSYVHGLKRNVHYMIG